MDWKILFTSIFANTAITGLILYFIKQYYTKYLDRKMELYKEEIRRKSNLYDMQFDAYRLIAAMVYRARNTAKDINNTLGEKHIDYYEFREYLHKLNTYNETVIELLYDNKAILTNEVFNIAHDAKNKFRELYSSAKKIEDFLSKNTLVEEKHKENYYSIYAEIELVYNALNIYIKKKIEK